MPCSIGTGRRWISIGLWLWLALVGPVGRSPAVAAPSPARPDTLHLNYQDSGLFGHYFAYCFEPCARPTAGQRAVALWQAGVFRALTGRGIVQGGYRQDRLWLRVAVVNTLPQRTHFVWSLYSFVDSATLFVQPEGRGCPRAAGGASSRVVAARRPFPARAVCLPFWLDAHARAVLYLRVENYAGQWYLPTDLSTTEGFLSYETSFFAFKNWAWLLGLYVGSALFNLILYAFLRDRIHLWYGAYVFFITWSLLMEDSLDTLLLPQAAYGLGRLLGEYNMLLLALACGLRIMALFVRLRQSWPRLNRLSWALSALGGAYAVGYGLLFGPALRAGTAYLRWLNGGREVLLWGLLLGGAALLLTVLHRGRPPQRRLGAVYALTYLLFFLGSMECLLNLTGVTDIHFVEPNALAWGLALELLTLSILLTGRFRYSLRRTAELRLREREAAGQRLIAAQDEEREALARELHDALAPGLTALHLAWQGRQVRQALAQAPALLADAHAHTEALLRQLRHDVRALSQALLPTTPGAPLSLPDAVTLLTETLSFTDDGPHISCACDPAAAYLPAALQAAGYRLVAELLHNALRHAQAGHVRVEVCCRPASLRLCVQDDGQGFDPAAPPPRRGGLGLRGVQARASYLHGQVQVRSRPGRGTVVTVELPVLG